MDCSEPSTYNKKVDWYRGRGYWFDYPQVKMKNGKWIVEAPAGMEGDFGLPQQFETLQEVFNLEERDHDVYERYISKVLKRLIEEEGKKFGALVMEPVLLGAGGMILVDPLFQNALARVVRTSPSLASMAVKAPSIETDNSEATKLGWTGLPVVLDEVFTGVYRLGRFSSSTFIDTHADISVHAKLLTGGLLPLCVTLASQSIFEAFLSDEKSDALLHGHSYTAHAVGCHVANVSLNKLAKTLKEPLVKHSQTDWIGTSSQGSDAIWSTWSKAFVENLSLLPRVDGVIAIGSVLAITIVDEAGAGYNSNAAIALRDALLAPRGKGEWGIHSRVLGNVFYLMSNLNTPPRHMRELEATVSKHLEKGPEETHTELDH